MKKSIIRDRSYNFSLEIIKIHQTLVDLRHFAIADQLLRSGTSIGANIEEAINAISRKEFLAKMFIALKEAQETNYWIRLIIDSKIISHQHCLTVLEESQIIVKIISKICKTTRFG